MLASGPKNCTHSAYPQITSTTATDIPEPERGVAGPVAHRPRMARREHHHQHQGGQGRVGQQFLADEHLRGGQQAEPGAGPDGGGRGR